jgi:FixJ family two-component response regulator
MNTASSSGGAGSIRGRGLVRAQCLNENNRLRRLSSGTLFVRTGVLRFLAGNKLDCVVLDVHMLEMNGREVQSHLKSANADIPVIVISGEHDPGAHAVAKRNGAHRYLNKPVDADLLLEAIRNAIVSRPLIDSRLTR